MECGREMADQILGAELLERAGSDHLSWLGDQDETLRAIRDPAREDTVATAVPAGRVGHYLGPRADGGATLMPRWTGSTSRGRQHQSEIAQRLYLSPRIVETHVAQVMQTLGLARRAEIAAEGSRQGL
ncbi:hypothetical protein N798_16600 [Knoellia flava TL1]|uniref:HTH luxR-type domain-containing protein n=2 Tax=Knoellia flava TaxID=913969 RepID=A0A8H9FQH2_9MICO|nr:hypothetical protein N798_16600 [Knoellia flava TL1]GGB71539.1 hypothetical protein GCM10011314_08640 [Knoellia flava]